MQSGIIALLLLSTASCAPTFAQTSGYLSRLLPAGVAVGMKGSELRDARKGAVGGSFPGQNSDNQNDYDLVERSGPATFSRYYVRGGSLSGYMRITRASAISPSQQQLERELITPDATSGFVKEAEEKALRAERNLDSIVVSATLWKSTLSKLKVYTVVTGTELTAIVFDPGRLSKETFFAPPELKKDLDEQAAIIRNKLAIKNSPATTSAQSSAETIVPTESGGAVPAAGFSRQANAEPLAENSDRSDRSPADAAPLESAGATVWPWVVGGISTLLVIAALALKRRA
jgi:hypothetical protein